MPKIKTTSLRLTPQGFVNSIHIKVEIWYNDGVFFSPLREEYYAKYEGFESEQLEKFGLTFREINRSKSMICIVAKTESELEEDMVKFYQKEIESTTLSRKVIIIHYLSPNTSYGSHHYNEQHPQIALQLGLTYAMEFTIGEEKSYSTKAEGRYGRGKFRIWDSGTTIIDDTKENRQWLETLYSALKNVETALDKITETNETLQKFISSGKKLLTGTTA
jgi:hypothetical protein